MVAQRAAWSFAPKSATAVVSGPWLRGRGFAYDRARAGEASDTPGLRGPVWAAWVVDIEVNPETGVTRVRRVVAGQASGDPRESTDIRFRGAGCRARNCTGDRRALAGASFLRRNRRCWLDLPRSGEGADTRRSERDRPGIR